MSLGYCYKKTCESGYSKSSFDGRQCWGDTRNQLSHKARCDKYSHEEGSSRYLSGGECWQGCNKNHASFAGACFPPAELTLSINMVADALSDIIEFIEDLPIGKYQSSFAGNRHLDLEIAELNLSSLAHSVNCSLLDSRGHQHHYCGGTEACHGLHQFYESIQLP